MMRVAQSSLPDLRGVVCIAQHQGEPAGQQDRVAVFESRQARGCALAVLADRLGTRSSDAVAAENVVLATQQCFDRFSPEEESPQSFFRVLIDQVHTVLRLAAVTAPSVPRSSFAAVLIQPERIDWCQVGSTAIYHFRGAALLHRAFDHRAGPGFLGARQSPLPGMGAISDPCSGDSIMLCSEGVWSGLDANELANEIGTRPCREAAGRLIDTATRRANGNADNCSLVLIGLARDA
jgi:serine/threonine protein phosphatase PrpC